MTREADDTTVMKFRDDEDGYRGWVSQNPGGWVLNAGRHLAPSDGLVLHGATCHTISGGAHSNHTTRGYIKICSTDRTSLVGWTQREAGAEPRPCRYCSP